MRVELSNALGVVGVAQIGMHPVGKIRPLCFTGGIVADGGEDFAVMVARGKGVKNLRDASERGGTAWGVERGGLGERNDKRPGTMRGVHGFAFCSLRLAWGFCRRNPHFRGRVETTEVGAFSEKWLDGLAIPWTEQGDWHLPAIGKVGRTVSG